MIGNCSRGWQPATQAKARFRRGSLEPCRGRLGRHAGVDIVGRGQGQPVGAPQHIGVDVDVALVAAVGGRRGGDGDVARGQGGFQGPHRAPVDPRHLFKPQDVGQRRLPWAAQAASPDIHARHTWMNSSPDSIADIRHRPHSVLFSVSEAQSGRFPIIS